MTIQPAKVLDRKLAWKDFKTQTMSAPQPGQVVKSAATMPVFAHGPLACNPTATKPITYKTTKPTVTISLDPSSWVADFVSSWPQANQDALLDHEQQHFMIGALSGRDMHDELDALAGKSYASASDGVADIQSVLSTYAQAEVQKIQDKYDADTKHDPVKHATEQAKWKAAIADAKANSKTLRAALKAAKLYP
jgi:hypothetical protein